MKKCPQCGALMEKSVNFCTKCGTDLREVIVEQETSKGENVQVQETPVEVQNATIQTNSGSNFQSYWQWLVESWKNPAQSGSGAESWYGWVTILIEDFLFILGLYFFAKSLITGAAGFANQFGADIRSIGNYDISFSIIFRVFMIILIFEVIVIGSNFVAYKFIYGGQPKVLAFVNHSVHASNLNLILSAVFFVLMMLGLNSIRFTLILIFVMLTLFLIGQSVTLLSDSKAMRDRVFGALIAFAIIFVCMAIMNSIIFNSFIRAYINQ